MKILTGTVIIVTAFLVAWTRHRVHEWETWTNSLEEQLLMVDPVYEKKSFSMMATAGALPTVVQKYFEMALPKNLQSSLSTIRSVRIHQEGHFYFGSTWVPFEARQVIRAVSPPGFLWDATISMTDKFQQKDLQKSLLPTMQVADALVEGGKQAYLRAALVNVFDSIFAKSTISEEDDDASDEDQFLWVGEAMRWLAEAVIVPTALQPEMGLVQWKELPDQDNSALLILNDPRTSTVSMNHHVAAVRLEVNFDPDTGLIHRVAGLRPYEREVLDEQRDLFSVFTRKHTSWEWRQWEGLLTDYKYDETTGLFVPHHMEAGWVTDEDSLALYFKGDNVALHYEITKATKPAVEGTADFKPVAEAVVPDGPNIATAEMA